MSVDRYVDKAAAKALIKQINDVEHILQVMRNYVDTQHGVVMNINAVAELFNDADDCMKLINNLLVKFL